MIVTFNFKSVVDNGQPSVNGWYMVFDGDEYDRMLWNGGEWIAQTHTETRGVMCSCNTRDNMTKYITHYSPLLNDSTCALKEKIKSKIIEYSSATTTSKIEIGLSDIPLLADELICAVDIFK